jgi:Xaa-Pro aminopeptidase
VTHTTSAPERTRRVEALRKAMDENGYDALLVAGRGDEFMRGRLQYVSDVFQWAGWGFVLLPRREEGVLLCDPLGGYEASDESWLRDVRVSATPSADLASMLHDLGAARGRIGVAGLADIMNAAHAEELRAALTDAKLVDATDVFDDVRAIKSDEEIANLAQTSDILRTVFTALEAEIRPGAREVDVLAEAHRLCRQMGCVEGIAMMGRAPAAGFGHGKAEPILSSDIMTVDLEWGGPTGYWLELRRCYSFGPPPDAVKRLWEAKVETFEACLSAMRPGASSADILVARDAAHARHGLTAGDPDVRYSAHGIGVDSLEPPWVPGKERELRARMMLSLHPNAVLDDATQRLCGAVSVGDNVLVTADGPRRMTYEREEWVVLDA